MKRKISDLLDDIQDDSIELEGVTPLSAERIKERTRRAIRRKETPKKRWGLRLLTAAAILSLMSITAFAAENIWGAGDWFREMLNHQLAHDKVTVREHNLDVTLQETISERQIQLIDELGTVFEQKTITDQGTTMTLSAAYADERVIHLYFQVTAPEGTVLPDGDYFFHSSENLDEPMLEMDKPLSCFVWVDALPDADPRDNRKDFFVTIHFTVDGSVKFNDGTSKIMHIPGIFLHEELAEGQSPKRAAPGSFSFDIGMVNQLESTPLEVKGLAYTSSETGTWTHDGPCQDSCRESLTGEMEPETNLPVHSQSYDYTVTMRELKLSPLSMAWSCTYSGISAEYFPGLKFRIVMKDGTSFLFGGISSYHEHVAEGIYYFTTPVDLSQVDYILLGDPELGDAQKVFLP